MAKSNLENIFIYYLLCQPLLDVLANFSWPVSELVRGSMLGIAIIYLFFYTNKNKKTQLGLTYITIVFTFFLIHLYINSLEKEQFSLIIEVTHVIKTGYFIVMLLTYLSIIRSWSKGKNWEAILLNIITLNMVQIIIIMLLATLTDTAKRTYQMLAKAGHTGWFFSGNELGVILAVGICFLFLNYIEAEHNKKQKYFFILILLLTGVMLVVGTKVSLFSAISSWITVIILTLIRLIKKKNNGINVIVLCVAAIFMLIFIPVTPAGHNTNMRGFGMFRTSENLTNDLEGEVEFVLEDVLSGRSEFLQETRSQYQNATISQQLFGMGYGGNQADPKLIEMDFLDWFFGFGVIGFILLFIPIVMLVVQILIRILKLKWEILSPTPIIISLSILLVFGSSFIAGHVLSSPAVSIYLVLAIAYLYTYLAQRNDMDGIEYQ